MPSESSSSKKDSNFKIIVLVAIFLIVALLAVLYYYNNYSADQSANNSSNDSSSSDQSDWVTYTSTAKGYSISYPSDWTKVEPSGETASAGLEILFLNLSDTRENGKPNIIITAGAADTFCDGLNECRALGNSVFAQYKANGDQTTIDAVLATFKAN